jgi:hypothetical protein
MKPLLQHLENESLLLLYLADEMPAEDREELELMLSRDAGLRAQLQALSSAQETSFSVLASLDAADPLPAPEPAMRRINRSMQQWWADELARPPEAPPARSILPLVGWSVGTAIAASMIFCIWWGFNPDTARSRTAANTQPANSQLNSDNTVATAPGDTSSPSAVAHADSSANISANTSSDPNVVEIVTVDTPTQHLADLETSVRDDFAARD